MTTADPIARLKGICKEFQAASGRVLVLENVDWELFPTDRIAVVGPSGSGKSTLLYLLGLLEPPTAGTLELVGKNVANLTDQDRATLRNSVIGFVFQDQHILPQCTVLENVLLPALAGRSVTTADLDRARQLLERVGLKDRIDHFPAQLSGGERQRAAVCRAILLRPRLLLADEPTGNLDPMTAEAIGGLLLELAAEQGSALVCVTHNQELAGRFPQQLTIRAGQLVAKTAST